MRNMERLGRDTPEHRQLGQLVARLEELVRNRETDGESPTRARAVIFDETGEHVVGIKRTKPGRGPYAVYPGGGCESGESPEAAIWRELAEELGFTSEVVQFEPWTFDEEGQRYFVGRAIAAAPTPRIGGPELDHDPAVSGTYEPAWIPLTELVQVNMVPETITELILQAAA